MPEPVVDPPLRTDPGLVAGGAAAVVGEAEAQQLEVAPTRRFGFSGWFSICWLVLVGGLALLAPVLPIPGPNERFIEIARTPPVPSLDHLLGGDAGGQDMLSLVVYGARNSLLIGIAAIILGLLVGGSLGLIAGYFRGRIDSVLTTFFNVLLSVPALVLALALVSVLANPENPNTTHGKRLLVLIVALGIVIVPILGRITRASALSWSEREFVKAAQVAGAGHLRIMIREVLPNVVPAMMSIALLGVGIVIVAEGGLSLLGVGVNPTDQPSWGNLIASNRDKLDTEPYIVFVPSVAIFLTVLSLNNLGDLVRARFDVKEAAL